jgi:hypothetical protein
MTDLNFIVMEIILAKQCKALKGSIGRAFGYFIVGRKNRKGDTRFYSQRSRHSVPPDGHWRFIVACAELAHMGLHIADIRLDWSELHNALREACHFIAARNVRTNADRGIKLSYDARDILNLKTTFGL